MRAGADLRRLSTTSTLEFACLQTAAFPLCTTFRKNVTNLTLAPSRKPKTANCKPIPGPCTTHSKKVSNLTPITSPCPANRTPNSDSGRCSTNDKSARPWAQTPVKPNRTTCPNLPSAEGATCFSPGSDKTALADAVLPWVDARPQTSEAGIACEGGDGRTSCDSSFASVAAAKLVPCPKTMCSRLGKPQFRAASKDVYYTSRKPVKPHIPGTRNPVRHPCAKLTA
jgi:hypothetical protein